MKVLITSQNPVKLNACKQAFSEVFPALTIDYEPVKVSSDVSEQPLSDAETLRGALNRIRNARNSGPGCDYIAGIEGGACIEEGRGFSFAWVVIDNGQKTGQARTAAFEIPVEAVKLLQQGYELGHANDKLFSLHNSKQKSGAIGILTNDLVTRTDLYKPAVIMALLPFMEHNNRLF